MLSKTEISRFSKLKLKKYRDSEKLFIAEGKRLVCEGINSNYICKKVIITKEFAEKETRFMTQVRIKSELLERINVKDFAKLTSTKNPQGILAVFSLPEHEELIEETKILVGLENISDPGNLGTILRSCAWFGINHILLSRECADVYNPKVLRASMGAVFKVKITENTDLVNSIKNLKGKGYKALYADMKGLDYRKIDFDHKSIIIFSNEAFGPSPDMKKICDDAVTIPKRGEVESLNVAAAAAVILSQIPD